MPHPDGGGRWGGACIITDPPTVFDTGLVVGEVVGLWAPDELPGYPINIHITLEKNPVKRGERQKVTIFATFPDHPGYLEPCCTVYAQVFYPGGGMACWNWGFCWPIAESTAPGLAVVQITVKRGYPCLPPPYGWKGYRVWRTAVGFYIE